MVNTFNDVEKIAYGALMRTKVSGVITFVSDVITSGILLLYQSLFESNPPLVGVLAELLTIIVEFVSLLELSSPLVGPLATPVKFVLSVLLLELRPPLVGPLAGPIEFVLLVPLLESTQDKSTIKLIFHMTNFFAIHFVSKLL